jgi:type IV secretory pathway VirB2 component (pilin)
MIRSYFLFLFFIVGFFTQSSFAEYRACGVNEPCRDGYYCMGALGQSSSGVCTANGLNITLCRFVKFIQNDIFTYIALFASIFIGIFLFIGRASTTVIAQVVIGIGILFGSQQLLLSISGDNQEVCSASEAKICLSDVKDISKLDESAEILNLERTQDFFGNTCNGLDCAIWSCPQWSITSKQVPIENTNTGTDTGTGTDTDTQKYETVYTCKEISKKSKKVILPRSSEKAIQPEPQCTNFEITCAKVGSPITFNYLSCQNNCTSQKYYAKIDRRTDIKTCKDLALRNVTYK